MTLVAVVTSEPNGPLARRVKAELSGLGVDVLVLKPPAEGTPSRAPLEQVARNVGAIAAVRLVMSETGKIEIWVADRVTGKAVVRELDAPSTTTSVASVAVGTVELLRASLMELHAPDPPRGEIPPTPKLEALALPSRTTVTILPPPPPPKLALALEAGAELGVRGLGPSVEAGISVWLRLADRFGVRALGQMTLAASHTQSTSGSVATQSQLLGALASYDLAPPDATWVPTLQAGIATAHVTTTGTAAPPYLGTTDSRWFAVPLGGVGLGWTFVHGLRLRADALAGAAVPSADVRTPTGSAGHWGAPLVSLTAGFEVLWGG